jgi:hypothetical protein
MIYSNRFGRIEVCGGVKKFEEISTAAAQTALRIDVWKQDALLNSSNCPQMARSALSCLRAPIN